MGQREVGLGLAGGRAESVREPILGFTRPASVARAHCSCVFACVPHPTSLLSCGEGMVSSSAWTVAASTAPSACTCPLFAQSSWTNGNRMNWPAWRQVAMLLRVPFSRANRTTVPACPLPTSTTPRPRVGEPCRRPAERTRVAVLLRRADLVSPVGHLCSASSLRVCCHLLCPSSTARQGGDRGQRPGVV